jgi:hypothetical protein
MAGGGAGLRPSAGRGRLGVRGRLPGLARARGAELGTAFLDGASIRAHAKAAGAPEKGRPGQAAAKARRSGAPVAAGHGAKAAAVADAAGRAVAFRVAPGQAHESPHAVPLLARLPGVPLAGGAIEGWWRIAASPATPCAATPGTGGLAR